MVRSMRELRETSDNDLIREHDDLAKNTGVGTDYYVQELDRRSRDRAADAALTLARRTYWLSVASAALSVVAAAVAVVTLIVQA